MQWQTASALVSLSLVCWSRHMPKYSVKPNLSVNFAGIKSPNPFWLASAPPTNTGEQIMRAFDAGWGGAVWKTMGAQVTNTSSRYSSIDWNGQRTVSYTHLRAHETGRNLVCRLLLEKKK